MRAERRTETADDRALLRAVRARQASAVARLYDRYGSLLLALAIRILRDRGDAEEVVGDVFWDLWKRPERFDEVRGTLSTFLVTVTRSRAIDRVRTETRKRRLEAGSTDDPEDSSSRTAGEGSPFDDAVLSQRRARVRTALDTLTREQRTPIEMAFYDGLSHSEIARELSEPLGTVKSRIRYGLIRLRESLRTEYGEEDRR